MKSKNKIKGFTIQFLPHAEIESLSSTARIKKLLDVIVDNKLIVLQGRLKAEEETRLIEDTMILVGRIKGFKGIELAVISPNTRDRSIFSNFKHGLAAALIGDIDALTIIGPASAIKEMKKDPRKLEVMMSGK